MIKPGSSYTFLNRNKQYILFSIKHIILLIAYSLLISTYVVQCSQFTTLHLESIGIDFVRCVALSPKSTAMAMAGRSVHKENDRRNYFIISLHESMGPGLDRTHDLWICSQTRICSQTCYLLHFAAWYRNGL